MTSNIPSHDIKATQKCAKARGFLQMAKRIQAFRETEVRRAVRALRDAGVEIRRVTFEGGKFEFITGEDTPFKAAKAASAKAPAATDTSGS